jgi:hypothetical protein
MEQEATMKDLCKAMGICWHEDMSEYGKPSGAMLCRWCGRMFPGDHVRNPTPADQAFCWRVLQYMMGRGDWGNFYQWVERKQMADEARCYWYNTIKWLLSDPARFIELANEWCKTHAD